MDLKQIEQELKKPFSPADIEWRIAKVLKTTNGDKAIVLAYVTNRAMQNKLDEVFGIGGWKNEFTDWKGKGVLCGISCFVNGEWITKWDGAEETNMESTKGGLSDAMKRAGYQWGIGRYLYKLEEVWVDIKSSGDKYINVETKKGNGQWVKGYWNIPKLPPFALPDGFKYENKPKQPEVKKGPIKPPENKPAGQTDLGNEGKYMCSDCGVEITEKIKGFSEKTFKRPLCYKCQQKAKKAG